MRVRRRRLVAAIALCAVAAIVSGVLWWRGSLDSLINPERCQATADSRTVDLDLDQAENAATIASVAQARGLPARAVTIALATAYQESDLHNIGHGDRDSVGLFQQRPSQGWGTEEQIQDPVFATNAFYDALVKVPGYTELEITVAAQEVQRSAFPDAYADHEADARVLASALTGNSQGALTCTVEVDDVAAETMTADGLTGRAAVVRDDLNGAFGTLPMGGFEPGGVTTGHIEGSAHYEGRAIDVFFRPISEESTRQGWAVAQWLVAHAERLQIATVIFDERVWSAAQSEDGWRPYEHPDGPTDNPILRHLDHVHVDVLRGS
jgi:hypothetical protein